MAEHRSCRTGRLEGQETRGALFGLAALLGRLTFAASLTLLWAGMSPKSLAGRSWMIPASCHPLRDDLLFVSTLALLHRHVPVGIPALLFAAFHVFESASLGEWSIVLVQCPAATDIWLQEGRQARLVLDNKPWRFLLEATLVGRGRRGGRGWWGGRGRRKMSWVWDKPDIRALPSTCLCIFGTPHKLQAFDL